MSLSVSVHKIDPQTLKIIEDIKVDPQMGNDIAGFESWREKLYGSQIIKEIGCNFLPELSSTDIFAAGEDLNRLRTDCHLILTHIRTVSENTLLDPADITFRINNILMAIDTASKFKDRAVWIS